MKFFCRHSPVVGALGAALALAQVSLGIKLDLTSKGSIKAAAKTCVDGALKYYKGNEPGQVPGLAVEPYFWWEAGALMGQLVEYSHYTGDSSYNDLITKAMLFQVGDARDYMPRNQTKTEGNDDQLFWAFAAMSAAELKYPDPPSDQPSWLALAQAVFNLQTARWDAATCGGGLRWQIFLGNNGFNLKNTISNGGFFQLASRLARYTHNETYADWANKAWDWLEQSPVLTKDYKVYDNVRVEKNCADADQHQWSYNIGTLLMGAANMYNHTDGDAKWKTRVEGLVKGTDFLFPAAAGGKIMAEVQCESTYCNNDQRSFKAYLSRWMSATTQLAPFTAATILPRLRASAQGAAAQCSGGTDGTTCGQKWAEAKWDGNYGLGEQMSALSVIQATLIEDAQGPVTDSNGGTSKGDPNAGSSNTNHIGGSLIKERTMSLGDRIGAAFLTLGMLVGVVGGAWFMVSG